MILRLLPEASLICKFKPIQKDVVSSLWWLMRWNIWLVWCPFLSHPLHTDFRCLIWVPTLQMCWNSSYGTFEVLELFWLIEVLLQLQPSRYPHKQTSWLLKWACMCQVPRLFNAIWVTPTSWLDHWHRTPLTTVWTISTLCFLRFLTNW